MFQHIFFGGLDPHLRHETWPFLLHYYPWDSTFEEREAIRNDRYIQYQDIRKMRYNLFFSYSFFTFYKPHQNWCIDIVEPFNKSWIFHWR